MDKVAAASIVGIALAVGGLAWAFWPESANVPGPAAAPSNRTAVEEAAGVTVKAVLYAEDPELRFAVTLDTHTEDLSGFDPARDVEVEDGDGSVSPSSARVVEETSHHVEAQVVFPARLGPFTLVVKDVGGVGERRLAFG